MLGWACVTCYGDFCEANSGGVGFILGAGLGITETSAGLFGGYSASQPSGTIRRL